MIEVKTITLNVADRGESEREDMSMLLFKRLKELLNTQEVVSFKDKNIKYCVVRDYGGSRNFAEKLWEFRIQLAILDETYKTIGIDRQVNELLPTKRPLKHGGRKVSTL